MSGSNRKPNAAAIADSKDTKSTPVSGGAATSVNTDGKAGTPVQYVLYIMPKVDPTQAPPKGLNNAVILCPEEKGSYSAFFVRNGLWDKNKNVINKVTQQKFELEGVIAEGLLPKTMKNDKALNAALALGKIPTFANLPHDILTDSIFSQLKAREKAALPRLSESLHTTFQSTLDAAKLLHYVAYGLQEDAEKMLQKAEVADKAKVDAKTATSSVETSEVMRLLRAKNPVTDCSGRSFNEPGLTPFQYAYWAMDWHMLRMLEKYIPVEEQAAQLKDLRENKVKYGLVLLSVAPEEKLDLDYLRKLSSQNQNKPILIKQNEALQLYGYDFKTTTWKLTPVKDTKIFKDLPFPQRDFSASYSLRVCPTAPTVNNIQNLVPGNNSAYILVQTQAGTPPSALYYVDRSGALPAITELSGCNLLTLNEVPTLNNLNRLPFLANAAYARYQDKLFYVNKRTSVCVELKLAAEELKKFDAGLKPTNQARYLLPLELQRITALTGHRELSPHFALNQNMDTLTRLLYPAVDNNQYPNMDRLSTAQLQAITLCTGHPLRVVDKTELTDESYQALAEGHAQGTEHGVHYDFSRLQEAYKIYLGNYDAWDGNQLRGYWIKQVGGAQDEVPGHVRDEYCRPDRSFDPVPDFREQTLPRDGRLYVGSSFYSLGLSGLSIDFAVYRRLGGRGSAAWRAGGGPAGAGRPGWIYRRSPAYVKSEQNTWQSLQNSY